MIANSTDEKKLYLLDAFALIFRSYFAFAKNPIINSKGQNTSAILGFVNTLNLLLKKTNSTHIAVCFDSAEQTQREEVFADYKANRAETPEDIKFAVPYIKAIVKAFNIPLIETILSPIFIPFCCAIEPKAKLSTTKGKRGEANCLAFLPNG